MRNETIIKPLCLGKALTVSVSQRKDEKRAYNFKTGSCRITFKDVYELTQDIGGNTTHTYQIPKRLYNALIAWQTQLDNE